MWTSAFNSADGTLPYPALIADKPAAVKVFPVHIYSGYLMVGVGGIVIDASGGITA